MGYVYLLMTYDKHGEEVFKIGVSKKHPEFRIKQLQTGNNLVIELLHFYESANYKRLERWMHRLYGDKKTEADNEWFYLSNEDVLNFMDKIKEADDNISFLIQNNHFLH